MFTEKVATEKLTVRPFGTTTPYGDPTTRFVDAIQKAAITLEGRTDEELLRDGRDHEDPATREHALYQYIARRGAKALPVVEQAIHEDPDTDLRINLLWALEWIPEEKSRKICVEMRNDADSRVQEWARVFSYEMGWVEEDFRRATEANYYEGRTFDETIYLHIPCNLYIRLGEGNDMWGHLLLSPQMLSKIYSQALACPVMETREHQIVIAKSMNGLRPDGSQHHEAFMFRGFTERTNPLQGNFYFETHTKRPFYNSGKAEDESMGVIDDVVVPFAREGQWFLNSNLDIRGHKPIEYVRGVFHGWAYVNLERIEREGGEFLLPGNSILATLHHPEIGPLTNTFVTGSFKGKLVDWSGDGKLDFNYLPAYATRDAEVDSDLDGVADVPGMAVSMPYGK